MSKGTLQWMFRLGAGAGAVALDAAIGFLRDQDLSGPDAGVLFLIVTAATWGLGKLVGLLRTKTT